MRKAPGTEAATRATQRERKSARRCRRADIEFCSVLQKVSTAPSCHSIRSVVLWRGLKTGTSLTMDTSPSAR